MRVSTCSWVGTEGGIFLWKVPDPAAVTSVKFGRPPRAGGRKSAQAVGAGAARPSSHVRLARARGVDEEAGELVCEAVEAQHAVAQRAAVVVGDEAVLRHEMALLRLLTVEVRLEGHPPFASLRIVPIRSRSRRSRTGRPRRRCAR
jgi:hypothetical protein